MKFTVFSEEELKPKTYEPGIYEFTIDKCIEKPSKASGNMMFELLLNISIDFGNPFIVKDYIVPETTPWKLHSFLKAINKEELYKKGEINSYELEGHKGKVEIVLEKYTGTNPEYIGKEFLKVKNYILPSEIPFDDDISF